MDATLFNKYQFPVKDKKTERGELLKELLDTINQTRHGTFKPLSIARVGMLTAHIPLDGLYFLLSVCKDSGNRAPNYAIGFSKRFWFELRPQK